MELMSYVTLEQMQEGRLARAEVYLERFGGLVVLQELTGEQVLKAAKYSMTELETSEGPMRIPDPARQQAVKLAFALVEPSLGQTDEERAAQCEVIEKLGYVDQLLLLAVLDRLTECTLTEEQREQLREAKPAADHLEALGRERSPTAVIEAAEQEELEDLLAVALHVPQALFGQVPMSAVRLLAARLRRQQRAFAQELAAAVLEAFNLGGSE